MTATATETRPFTIGDRVTYDVSGNNYTGTVRGIFHDPDYAASQSNDSLFVVAAEPPPNSLSAAVARTGPHRTWADDVREDEQGHWVSVRWDNVRHADPVPEPEPPTAAALAESAAQVTALEATVSDLRAQVETARAVLTQIGEALRETANQSEWCGEYDRRVNALYEALPGRYAFDETFRDAAIREREFEVCVHWTETIEHSTTVTVSASSQSAAVDMVSDSPEDWVTPDDRYSVNERSVEWDEIHVD